MSAVTPGTNGAPRTARDAARHYLRRGVFTVPVQRAGKKPWDFQRNRPRDEWEQLRVTEAQIDELFPADGNVGVLLGAPSGGIVDVDLDCPEARRAAPHLLPPTGMVGGRESAPDSHYFFVADDPPAKASEAYRDPCAADRGRNLLLELRSTGGQSLVAPSVYGADPDKGHPQPERFVWHRHGEPGRVSAEVLQVAVRCVAAAALLARYWPKSGRHVAALALAGGLRRAGWLEEAAAKFVTAICAAAGDDELSNRLGCVRDTFDRGIDEKATGWPTLANLLGERGEAIVARVTDWLGAPPAPRVAVGGHAAPPPREWPDPPHEAAFYGLAGDVVRTLDPHTEADRVAVLVQMLLYFGNVVGRRAHFRVEADRHYTNEFAVLMGRSSKARKGTSHGQVHGLYGAVEGAAFDPDALGGPTWAADRIQSGLSSGEGLIWAVRDPIEKKERVKERGQPAAYETVVADEGVSDKRLLVYEPEFANVLKQTERQGNTLSAVLRQAWETGNLRSLTKNNPAKATGAHISVSGHITVEELTRYLTVTESANGFGNRFMWFAVRRSKLLPEGGRPDPEQMAPLRERLAGAVAFAQGADEVVRDEEARELWRAVYPQLSADRPGLAGCLLGRAEAHVMRLAMLYALLDGAGAISAEHLTAAVALWDYAERSVFHVFGDALGNPLADDLARLIRQAGPAGVTRTAVSDYLGRNVSSDRVNGALQLLVAHGLAHPRPEQSGGRPTERWFAGRAG